MKLRWKLLSLLVFFFLGSFMIVGWRAQNLYSQEYSQEIVKKEIQNLEQLSFFIDDRLESLVGALQKGRNMKSVLSHYDVKLLAYAMNTEGKWKARWYAGDNRFRSQARSVMKQIPFRSLPLKRKTWHPVRYKGSEGYAYVVPQKKAKEISYYIFFLGDQFFARSVQGSSGQYSVFSPLMGELFSSKGNSDASDVFQRFGERIKSSQQGWIPISSSRNLIYMFHPDLQLYFFKEASTPVVESSTSGIMLLAGLILVLMALFLFSTDYFMKSVFERADRLTDALLALGTSDERELPILHNDELSALESAHNLIVRRTLGEHLPKTLPKEPTEAVEAESVEEVRYEAEESAEVQDLLEEIRPMTINALGQLHKMKESKEETVVEQVESMETELREMRRLMDRADASEQANVFEPEIKIRRPKRESNELSSI